MLWNHVHYVAVCAAERSYDLDRSGWRVHLWRHGTSMQPASVTVTAAPGQRAMGSRARDTGAPPSAPGAAPCADTEPAAGMARRLGVVRYVPLSPLDMHTLRAACEGKVSLGRAAT